jgi:hypothetical protein
MRFIEGETFQQAIERFHAPNADKETRGQGDKGNKHGVSPCPLVPLSFDSLEFRQLLQRFIAVCLGSPAGKEAPVHHPCGG